MCEIFTSHRFNKLQMNIFGVSRTRSSLVKVVLFVWVRKEDDIDGDLLNVMKRVEDIVLTTKNEGAHC